MCCSFLPLFEMSGPDDVVEDVIKTVWNLAGLDSDIANVLLVSPPLFEMSGPDDVEEIGVGQMLYLGHWQGYMREIATRRM